MADDDVRSPVEAIDTGSPHGAVEAGMALCLSGGGYRAMLFHVGVLWRLYEADLIKGLKRISSVSGGSITSAVLGLKWDKLSFSPSAVRDDFVREVVQPIRGLAEKTIDSKSIFSGIFAFDTISEKVADYYRKFLFGDATLQKLPDEPRFVINATNVQSGALWRFMKPMWPKCSNSRQTRKLPRSPVPPSSTFAIKARQWSPTTISTIVECSVEAINASESTAAKRKNAAYSLRPWSSARLDKIYEPSGGSWPPRRHGSKVAFMRILLAVTCCD